MIDYEKLVRKLTKYSPRREIADSIATAIDIEINEDALRIQRLFRGKDYLGQIDISQLSYDDIEKLAYLKDQYECLTSTQIESISLIREMTQILSYCPVYHDESAVFI